MLIKISNFIQKLHNSHCQKNENLSIATRNYAVTYYQTHEEITWPLGQNLE